MAVWNPANPGDWGRSFGLVAVPFFSRHRTSVPPGTHLMMQDGQAASFALHLTTPAPLYSTREPLEWAWSSNVRHTVTLDPATKTAVIRRWDDPAFQEHRAIGSDHDARKLVRDIERSQKAAIGPNVITSALEVFRLLRDALEERGGTDLDVVVAFNSLLLLVERWRDAPDQLSGIKLGKIVTELQEDQRAGFSEPPISKNVRDYSIGEFAKILLEPKPNGVPYALNADLLIRHASGLLYQEAHRQLAEPTATVRQGTLFGDALPSKPGGRRKDAPKTVHYTPPWLSRALVEVALKCRNVAQQEPLEVLDPACGSGVFLIETVRELENYHAHEVHLRGMDSSAVAGTMTSFCVGEASRDLTNITVKQSIRHGIDSLLELDWGQPDIILMNPPFKAWKDLSTGERSIVSGALGAYMAGRPDLSLAFIVRAIQTLKPGGVLASVVPYPFFSSKAAAKIRVLLQSDDYQVRLAGLFRGFKTFDKATVEAAVIVITRSEKPVRDKSVRVLIARKGYGEKAVRLLRATSFAKSIERAGFDLYNMSAETLGDLTWGLHRHSELQFVEALTARTSTQVKDFFTVRLGIRGIGGKGQKKVLLLSEGDLLRLAPTPDERVFFRPVADLIEQGRIKPSGFVFYPYGPNRQLLLSTETELAAAVPAFYREVLLPAKSSLQTRKSINRRKDGSGPNRNWWEPSEPVTRWLAAHNPRILSQEFGKKGNYALDESGQFAVVAGHGWCWNGVLPGIDVLLAYLAILNSNIFERLLKFYCPRLQGGQFRLEGRFVHAVPLPELLSLPGKLAQIGKRIHAGLPYDSQELDFTVLSAYGFSDKDTVVVLLVLQKEISAFLSGIYSLSSEKNENKAVDTVFNFVDSLLKAGFFSVCDGVLEKVDPERILPSVMVSFLMATKRAKGKLHERTAFHQRAMDALSKVRSPAEAERLLGKYR